MRSIRSQQQTVWHCKSAGRVEISEVNPDTGEMEYTGEYYEELSSPIGYKMCLNPTLGSASFSPYGLAQDTRREMTTHDMTLDFKIGDLFFVDVKPELNDDGTLKKAENGIDFVTPPDYYCNSVMRSKKGDVARYGITRRA